MRPLKISRALTTALSGRANKSPSPDTGRPPFPRETGGGNLGFPRKHLFILETGEISAEEPGERKGFLCVSPHEVATGGMVGQEARGFPSCYKLELWYQGKENTPRCLSSLPDIELQAGDSAPS